MDLVSVLAESAFEDGEESLVADLPAQHVEDHGALFEGHGLELGREGIEAADAGEGNGVIGERAGGDVLEGGLQGALAVLVFDIHQLAVARHAVGDPGVVEGFGADLGSPPLVGDGVGEEADAGLVSDARAHDGGEFGRPDGGEGVVGQFDDVEVAGIREAEAVGEEVVFAGGGLGQRVGRGLMGDGEVDLDVAGAGGDGRQIAAGNDGSGKAGLGPIEVVLVAGLAAGEGDGLGGAGGAAGEDAHPLRDADMDFGGEAVGHEAGGGKPAGGVEQVADGFLDGGELEAFDGAVFVAGDGAVVDEGPVGGLAVDEGACWR